MVYRELPLIEEMPAIFHEWLEWLPLFEDKSANTIEAYSQGVRRIVSYSDFPVSAFAADVFDQASLTDTVRNMRASGEVSKETLNQSLAALKSFYDYCVTDGLIEQTPNVSRIRRIAKLEVPQIDPEYYRAAEVRDLYNAALSESIENGNRVRWPSRDLAMCSFLAVLGLRASELSAADNNWISREHLVDSDRRATWMLHVVGKGKRIRRLPLSLELVEANERWQLERAEKFGKVKPEDSLFVTNDGERFNYRRLRYWLKILNNSAGLRDRSLHALRHTAGVQLAAEGVSMNVIQSLLGHASIATTGIYTELVGGELVGVLNHSGSNTLLNKALSLSK